MVPKADEGKLNLSPVVHRNTIRCVKCGRPSMGRVTFFKVKDGVCCEECRPFLVGVVKLNKKEKKAAKKLRRENKS